MRYAFFLLGLFLAFHPPVKSVSQDKHVNVTVEKPFYMSDAFVTLFGSVVIGCAAFIGKEVGQGSKLKIKKEIIEEIELTIDSKIKSFGQLNDLTLTNQFSGIVNELMGLSKEIHNTNKEIANTNKKIDDLDRKIDKRDASIERRFSSITRELDRIDGNVDSVLPHVNRIVKDAFFSYGVDVPSVGVRAKSNSNPAIYSTEGTIET